MLKIENLHKNFNEKVVFENFNLNICKGEFVTILGGNGAGKSTLFNLISGTIFPDSGNIFMYEKNVTFLPEHKRAKYVGRVFQDPLRGTSPNFTIEENLVIATLKNSKRNLKFASNKQNREHFKEKLSQLEMNLENRLNDKVGLLSGGQRQALTLLMATICEPRILLLDEHTAALDTKSQEKILILTEKIKENPEITTLMITHNKEIEKRFGENFIIIQ
ncbi:MAG: ATP-binding cassette domain-containing protein [Clostridiales bacterium]|jgi:putative ABC transport system ATP-binding protein|nr:ATP-binding cassette domain-containing protein [Clostridiales bacterium]